MGLTADRLFKLKLVDEVLPEPVGGAHRNPQADAETIKAALLRHLDELEKLPPDKLRAAAQRAHQRLRRVQRSRELSARGHGRRRGRGLLIFPGERVAATWTPLNSPGGSTRARGARSRASSSRSAAASIPPCSRICSAKQRRKFGGLRLVHVDHGLQAASGEWSRHCARVARALARALRVLKADIQRKRGESPEAAAREARYALLARGNGAGRSAGHRAASRRPGGDACCCSCFAARASPGSRRCPRSRRSDRAASRGRCCSNRAPTSKQYARKAKLQWVEDPSNMRHAFLAQFPAPATHAAHSRAVARRGQRHRAQRGSHGRGGRIARARSRSGISRVSPTATASTWPHCARCPSRDGAMRCEPSSRHSESKMPDHGTDDGNRRRAAHARVRMRSPKSTGAAPRCAGGAGAWYFR